MYVHNYFLLPNKMAVIHATIACGAVELVIPVLQVKTAPVNDLRVAFTILGSRHVKFNLNLMSRAINYILYSHLCQIWVPWRWTQLITYVQTQYQKKNGCTKILGCSKYAYGIMESGPVWLYFCLFWAQLTLNLS